MSSNSVTRSFLLGYTQRFHAWRCGGMLAPKYNRIPDVEFCIRQLTDFIEALQPPLRQTPVRTWCYSFLILTILSVNPNF